MNFQKLIVIGNVTKDPQRRKAKTGAEYTTLRVAVSDNRGQATYFPIVAFDKLGASVAAFVTKGRQVLVEGRVEVDPKTGRFKVVAARIVFGTKAQGKGIDRLRAKVEELELVEESDPAPN